MFEQFGKREEKYRKNFVENEIVCLEDNESLLLFDKEDQAILPFRVQNINEPPILCQASYSSISSSSNDYIITKKQVEGML